MTVSAFTPNLEKLSLSGCKNITDQGLRLLAGTCQQLIHLNLTRQVSAISRNIKNDWKYGCNLLISLYSGYLTR